MKKIISIAVGLILLFSMGCSNLASDNTKASLELVNQSSVDLKNVKWMNVLFANNTDSDFLMGSTVKKGLAEVGNGYIYFTRKADSLELRTDSVVAIEKGAEEQFVFTDNTIVVEVGNTTNTGTLKSNTKLKIVNGTAADILEPTWNQVLFETVVNGKNLVAGTSVEKAVNSGSGYITFKATGDTTVWRTTEQVSINNFESKIFTFEAATQVTQVNNISIVKPLSELLIPKMISINTEITFISDSTISMSWDAVPGATGYKIYKANIKTSLAAAFFKDVTSTSCLIDSLGSTEDCFFWITATNIYGESGYSTFKYVTFKTFTVGGEGPAGGNVFYDKGSRVGGWRYLEAAPVETEIPAQWGAYQYNVEGTSAAVGSGKNNTKTIVAFLNTKEEVNKAAQIAASLNYEGFADWFLPSKDELNLMYLNLKNKGIGGFGSSSYWSSSQGNTLAAWYQRFSDGNQYGSSGNKDSSNSVRVVRAF